MEEIYTTQFLLNRAFEKMENVGKKKKFSMKKPEVKKQNRKTYIKNFVTLCNSINRDINHVKTFMENELKVSSSINDDDMLMLNNIYHQGKIELVISKYAEKYIICSEPKCGSGNTEIIKENRISYLSCKSCFSKKAVN
jgi:translation initiation factor 2 subunit 2